MRVMEASHPRPVFDTTLLEVWVIQRPSHQQLEQICHLRNTLLLDTDTYIKYELTVHPSTVMVKSTLLN